MGGLVALMCALRHPGQYVSASALAPIAHPSACPWGQKAFSRYLGEAPGGGASAAWAQHDPTALVASYAGPPLHLKVTCGAADEFYTGKQLLPEDFVAAAQAAGVPVDFNLVEGYDHSFFLCVGGNGCRTLPIPSWLLNLFAFFSSSPPFPCPCQRQHLYCRAHQAPRQVPARLVAHAPRP
jgi:pimeloyl-ACP methyl ester carboxylesterase